MSNRKEKKIIAAVPAHESEVVVGQNCDRCGVDVPSPKGHRRRDFTLEFLEGSTYPSGDTDLEGWELEDCCDDCAAFLKELLVTNGFKLKNVQRNW